MRAPSGYHWSQQTSVPTGPTDVFFRAKAEIAGREVELLVIKRIVGDVHLSIKPGNRSIGLNGGGRVVI